MVFIRFFLGLFEHDKVFAPFLQGPNFSQQKVIAEYDNWIAIRDSNFACVTKLGQPRFEALWK
jgi:hypothetical protein